VYAGQKQLESIGLSTTTKTQEDAFKNWLNISPFYLKLPKI
jgi:hypothetical protein